MVRSRNRRTPFSNLAIAVLGALVWIFQAAVCHAQAGDERLVVGGSIAGKPATFILDTGNQQPFVITGADAKRFGLQADREPPPEAAIFKAISQPVPVVLLGGAEQQVSFAILKEIVDQGFGQDVLIGWPELKAQVIHYDRQRGILAINPDPQPRPANARSLPIIPGPDLMFDAGTEAAPLPVQVDTGWSGGVMLSAPLWNAWSRENPDLPRTYAWMYWLSTGDVALEQVLASEFRLGRLTLRNVLVSPLPDGLTNTAAVIGLAAFGNHALLVDGPGGSVWIGEPGAALVMPAYNRLGATFGPDLSAHVADNSPAAQAGIRDGDVLVAINDQAPDSYAATVVGQVWAQPAGTTFQLTLRRASELIERQVTLRDFLTGDP